ncbi:hypothetical protein FJK98_24910 [Micromonospora sp. HM134]|uniref:hypothetical protein n=1 Tax=unclassified Micromonospora TaxID=2617518 RepID=UPI0011987969|nr:MULTISPECIES: hypothetical protein [unclassified Micromonospora]QDY09993.1 hypothetical protein FJK98_24910 [Micromonospora sp. HM134]
MAHGEADHGCAQGEPCRPGHPDQPPAARPHRRMATEQVCRAAERADDELTLPRQRGTETVDGAASRPAAEPGPTGQPDTPARACRSDLAGWAGAHRHGPVRPGRRRQRVQRPPHRWC